jgi:hypothetical protein
MYSKLFILISFFSGAVFAADSLKSPNISANTLFLYRNSNFHQEDMDPTSLDPDQERNGLSLQEAEVQFYSDVDVYNRLNLLLSIHPEYEGDGTSVKEKWLIEPEEAFIESNVIPDVTLKVGKFKAAMGKHNQLHTHAYPFIETSLANKNLLGDEGLNDLGVSLAYLIPTSWFNEFTFQYLRGEAENEEFNSATPSDGVALVHWKNLLDLTDELTMEIGASYAEGNNSFRDKTSLMGGDLTFRWRPENGGLYHSLIWSTEYLGRTQGSSTTLNEKVSGFVSWIQYQFAQRWSALYRYDNLVVHDSLDTVAMPNDTATRNSLALVFMPSEFSSFKMEYDQRHGGKLGPSNESTEKALFLQANFTIGAHPAHSY